jgi:hypothetical protein
MGKGGPLPRKFRHRLKQVKAKPTLTRISILKTKSKEVMTSRASDKALFSGGIMVVA